MVDWHNYGKEQDDDLGAITTAFGNENISEVLGWVFGSGVLGVRQYRNNTAFKESGRRFDAVYASLNLHDHSNYKSMPGIGEIALFVKEYYRSRHNDYRCRKSIAGLSEEFNSEPLHAPSLSATVLAKPTGVSGDAVDVTSDTQARYLKNIYKENPEDVEVHLAYAEVWRQENTGSLEDAGESFRHADEVSDTVKAFQRASIYNAEGVKNRFENESFGATSIVNVDDSGSPVASYVNFRILTCKVGTLADLGTTVQSPIISIAIQSSHYHLLNAQLTDQEANDLVNGVVASVTLTSTDSGHTHNYIITWDGSDFVGVDTGIGSHIHEVTIENNFTGNLPYDPDKALNGIIDSTNRFSMRQENWGGTSLPEDIINSRFPRFSCADLDRICERIPGMDGEGAFIDKTHPVDDTISYLDRDGGTLNAAYYHRTISAVLSDAAGRSSEDAGFNDSTLYVAKNTKDGVVNKVSYMIPLEMLIRSPVETWNPYSISAATSAEIESGTTDGTQTNPYSDYSDSNFYYLIPYAFYADTNPNADPADTSGNAWMVSGVDGIARRCWGSGIKPFTADGSQRIRIPVYPVAQAFSHEGGRISRLEDKVGFIVKQGSGVTYDTAAMFSLMPDATLVPEGTKFKIIDLTLPIGIIDGSTSDPFGKTTTRFYQNKPVTGGALEWVEVYS